MDLMSRLLNPLIGFLLTLGFGFWLSRRGKPYNGFLFNVHKLIALATVILLAVAVYRWLQGMNIETLEIALLGIAAVSVIALFTSGALMSAGVGQYQAMKLVHNISPLILVLAIVSSVYFLAAGTLS